MLYLRGAGPEVVYSFVFLSLMIFFTSCFVEVEAGPAADTGELETRLNDILEKTNVPGMIAAIVSTDEPVWQGALGLADKTKQLPVSKDTLFRVGSISKSFVSLAVLILQARGQLDLELKIDSLVPEAGVSNPWEQESPVRLLHVLEHTAGFDDIHFRDYLFSDPDVKLLEGIRYNNNSRQVRWPPGTRMSYSNIGPPIAALVVEKISGQRFENFVQQEIFDVLGMTTATFFFDETVSKSYAADGKTMQPYTHISVRPSGALNASSYDMVQLLKMFLNRGAFDKGILLPAESISRMETAASTFAAEQGLKVGYGLGNAVSLKNGFVYHGHGGGIDGFLSVYAYSPKHGLGIFLSINAANEHAFELLYDEIHAFASKDLPPARGPSLIELGQLQLQAYTGYYQPDTHRAEFSRGLGVLAGTLWITQKNGKLIVSSLFGEDSIWHPTTENQFVKDGDALASLVFIEDDEGNMFAQGALGNLRKISSLFALSRWLVSVSVILLMLSSFVFAFVWGIRKLAGRLRDTKYLSVRILPLLTSLSFVLTLLIVNDAMKDLSRLGALSAWSIGYWLMSWLFTFLALISPIYIWLLRDNLADIGRGVWVHSFMVAIATTLFAAYFVWYGLIGIRFWAY